ncbi:GAP family protein [Formosa sp. PL04]|uniref:GAP family protein n=1 Tax=Formosa sp. PL04 TaxID=3081755 RepID=UPI0029819708|nr:GAP family protein [Formosa sp. PL04]MDW5288918.1 GAP family protein [Formosa sp. PL04]
MTHTPIPTFPLALTVMLGPQILVAILLITRKDPIKSSLVYIASIVLTLIATTLMYYMLVDITHFQDTTLGGRPMLKYVIVAFIVFLIIKLIANRHKATKPPKWMKSISTASLRRIFIIGFSLIAFMPADIVAAFSVGSLLNNNPKGFWAALPFFGAVTLIAATPLIFYTLLGKKGPAYLKKVNEWLNTHGYVINIIVLLFFIYLLLY